MDAYAACRLFTKDLMLICPLLQSHPMRQSLFQQTLYSNLPKPPHHYLNPPHLHPKKLPQRQRQRQRLHSAHPKQKQHLPTD